MNLDQLNNIDTANPDQVKALQIFLKTRGYYAGPIDGKWGGGTTQGAVKLREDLTNAANTSRDTAIANQEANDPVNNAIRGATEIGPYGIGMGAGATVGHFGGRALKEQDAAQRAEVKRIAADQRITGDVAKTQLRGMRTNRNAVTGAQFAAPALFLGSAEYLRRGIAPGFQDPKTGADTETSKWIKLGANLDQGVGLGVLGHQLFGLKDRIRSPNDAVDEGLIQSRPSGGTPPPESPALRPNSQRLIAAARAAGATGKLTKTTAAKYLANNVTAANRAAVAAELGVGPGEKIAPAVKRLASRPGVSSILAPLIAGGMAYDSASGEAEAAGATPGEARTRGAVAGTGAAAVTGGTLYGLNKLAQAAGPVAGAVRTGMSALGRMSGPLLLNDLAVQGHRAIYGEGPQYLDVPEPSPIRSVTREQNSGPLMQASALEIPGDIPPNAARDAEMNAMARAGTASQNDPFGKALNEFLAFAAEMQAEQPQEEQAGGQ